MTAAPTRCGCLKLEVETPQRRREDRQFSSVNRNCSFSFHSSPFSQHDYTSLLRASRIRSSISSMSLISLLLFLTGHPVGNFYRQECQCRHNKAERGEPTTVLRCILIGRKYRNLELDLSAVKTLSICNVLEYMMGY